MSDTQIRRAFLSMRFAKFCVVGGSGVLVNMAFLWFLKEIAGIYYLLASPIAIEISVLNNFIWNDLWTWSDRRKEGGFGYVKRLIRYNLSVSVAAVVGNIIILAALTELFGWYYLYANVVGIAVGTALNYIINDLWTFREKTI